MVFDRFAHETLESPSFKDWFSSNQDWLRPYAVFKVLKDLFNTAEHWQWGSLSQPSPEDIDRLSSPSCPHHRAVQLSYWTQYHLHLQLSKVRHASWGSTPCLTSLPYPIMVSLNVPTSLYSPHLICVLHFQFTRSHPPPHSISSSSSSPPPFLQASRYAESKKVVLKGDIPIGVDKRSVETWLEPHLFRMDKSTGAPPDYFDPNGQNWDFPTYDWEAMRDKDGGYPW